MKKNKHMSKNIILSKDAIHRKQGVVILSLKEYERLREGAIPNFYLEGKEAENLDKLVEHGLKEYQKGKCKIIKSLADLG